MPAAGNFNMQLLSWLDCNTGLTHVHHAECIVLTLPVHMGTLCKVIIAGRCVGQSLLDLLPVQ